MPLDRDAQLQRHVRLTRTCRSCRIRYQKGGEAPPSILAAGPRRDRAIEIGGVVVRLAPDRSPALGAQVVVLVAARKHEQEFLAGRRRPSASGAEEARGLELLEAVSLRHGEILPRGVPIQAADDLGERVSGQFAEIEYRERCRSQNAASGCPMPSRRSRCSGSRGSSRVARPSDTR